MGIPRPAPRVSNFSSLPHGIRPRSHRRPLLALTTSPSSSSISRPHQRRSWLWPRPRALFLIAAGALTLLALTALFGLGNIDVAITVLYAAQPRTPVTTRARHTLKPGRAPPHGFDAFVDYAGRHGCLVNAALQRGWFRQRVKAVEERLKEDSKGLTALTVRDGKVHRPEYQGTYFDEDWENTINKVRLDSFIHRPLLPSTSSTRQTHTLTHPHPVCIRPPLLTVIINGRDEARVVFDAMRLLQGASSVTSLWSFPFCFPPSSCVVVGCGGALGVVCGCPRRALRVPRLMQRRGGAALRRMSGFVSAAACFMFMRPSFVAS
ncbi:hypothetical protein C8R44DRAFT_893216 [Mycena epipterygia]|nr:hypothetical protein C8R44DRAFT_893216 [Mycena epipterygia]